MAIATLTSNESGANSLIDINANFVDLDTTKADLASPTFTGTPTLPTGTIATTQSASDNSTKLATTAYVDNQVSASFTEDKLLVATISISSAEILALHTTAKTLVAAPGVGKLILIDHILFSFTGGTAYANGDNLRVQYNGDTTTLVTTVNNSFINTTSSGIAYRVGAIYTSITGTNKAVELSPQSATAFITGTGTMKAFIKYRIITL